MFDLMRYGISSSDIVAESFDGDIVVLDLASGKYFGFSDSGCAAWEALAAGVAVRELRSATSTLGGAAFDSFLSQLLEHELLTPRDDEAGGELTHELRDRIINAKEAPEIFMFDDLADLFKADPIHDVEEQTGWPIKKSR